MTETRTILKNGLRVVNFSSPHPFKFEDDSVLEACSADRAKGLMLKSVEAVERALVNGVEITDISLSFLMSPVVEEELERLEGDDSIDIIIVPLPVLQCCRGTGFKKVRGIRVADRVTKSVHTDRFCV